MFGLGGEPRIKYWGEWGKGGACNLVAPKKAVILSETTKRGAHQLSVWGPSVGSTHHLWSLATLTKVLRLWRARVVMGYSPKLSWPRAAALWQVVLKLTKVLFSALLPLSITP